MEVNGYRQLYGYQHSSKYLLLCSAKERNSSAEERNDESIFIFG